MELLPLLPFLFLWLVSPWAVVAHGPIHQQILAVTKRIERNPTNAMLYLKRSELYRIHQQWIAALDDCERATKFDSKLAEVDLYRGKAMRGAGGLKKEKTVLDRFLIKKPDHVDGLITRVRVLMRLNQYATAAKDFTRAIVQLPDPKTVEPIYLENFES